MKPRKNPLILACCAVLALVVTAHAKEKLLNPGFESGVTYWSADAASIETALQRTGSSALRIDQTTTARSAHQQVSCPPGAFVSASGWLRTASCTAPARLTLRFLDGYGVTLADHAIATVSGTSAYAFFEIEGVEAPATTVRARLLLSTDAAAAPGGYAYFDDLSLDVFAHGPVSRITNGGFESNFTGWTQGHAAIDTTNPYSGSKASKLVHQSFFTQSHQEIPCTPADSFSISFAHATAAATTTSALALRFYDNAGNILSESGFPGLSGTNAYATYYGDEITPPANAVKMRVRFVAGGAGTGASFLDDVRVTSGDAGLASPLFLDQSQTALIANPGFENGQTGWTSTASRTSTPSLVATGAYAAYTAASTYYINAALSSTGIPVQAGKYYRVSADLASAGTLLRPDLTVAFYTSSGTALETEQWFADSTLVGTRPYKNYGIGFFAPAGAATMKIKARLQSNGGGTLHYDNVNLYRVENLPVRAVPTYNSVSVYVARATPPTGESARFYYRKQGQTSWSEGFPPVYDATRAEYRGSLVGLDENSTYEVQALLVVDGVVSDEAGATVTTWSSSPPIATTYNVSDLYTSGEWKIENLHGSPTGWIKITGTGSNDVDGGYVTTAGEDYGRAILIKNCDYLILENIHVKGGRFHGIEVRNGDNIRISKCEIEGWARQPNVISGGVAYESADDEEADKPINNDAAVFINASNRVTVERSYLHDPRTGSHSQVTYQNVHPAGPNGVFIMNTSPRNGNHVIRYNDIIGGDQLRWNDAIEGWGNDQSYGSFGRDSDIHGNMLAHGSDDGVELDGGQINVRFFGNRIESFYTGISVAPNMAGPSYVYRNLVTNLGDQVDGCWSMVKNGGGTTYTKGRTFVFNNTMYAACNGFTGVGYGSDKDAGGSTVIRKMFIATTRNNIFYSTNTAPTYRNAISDTYPNPASDFDYDNLASIELTTAQVAYAAGQEPNGIRNNYPSFVNAAAGDFRLASASSAIDAGQPLANFAEDYAGASPDQGAYEVGAGSLMPVRPVAVSADKYLVTLTATANGGASTSVDVTLTTGDLAGAGAYVVRKNADTAWLSVTPASGTLSNNSTQVFTFTVATTGLSAGQREAVVLVRLANGLSIPISVTANVN